jgi:hypothetical protein
VTLHGNAIISSMETGMLHFTYDGSIHVCGRRGSEEAQVLTMDPLVRVLGHTVRLV